MKKLDERTLQMMQPKFKKLEIQIEKVGKEVTKLAEMFDKMEIYPCDKHLDWLDDYYENPIELCRKVLSK